MHSVYEIPVTTIDGRPQTLGDFAGKVLLVVNVASKCGLTPQYEQLEKLYEQLADQGFEVLGFPSNEFAGQEPGTEEEIMSFCRSTYGVQFPMFSKICVNGDARHPLYRLLVAAKPKAEANPEGGLRARLAERDLLPAGDTDIMWNFEKFLIGRDGEVLGRFAPDMTVEHPHLKAAIEQALAS